MANILIIEDSPTVSYELSTFLQKHGHQVQCVEDGLSAFSVLREATDVLIVDIGLPGINGLDLCITIRQMPLHATTPIIMMTGTEKAGDRRLAAAFGAKAFLNKPVSGEALLKAVNEELDQIPAA